MSETDSEYRTENSSDDESSEVAEPSEVAEQHTQHLQYPYPFLGRPYVTKSILNTIDTRLLCSVTKEISCYKVKCLQFKVGYGQKKYNLAHILFGDHAVSFSKVAG